MQIYRAFGAMAEWTGLEPATPDVTGRYSNQLNYHSVRINLFSKLFVRREVHFTDSFENCKSSMSSLLFKTWLCSAQRLRILQKNRHLPRAQTNFFEDGKISPEISTNAVRNSFLRIAENFHSSFRLLLHHLTLTNR